MGDHSKSNRVWLLVQIPNYNANRKIEKFNFKNIFLNSTISDVYKVFW